MHQIGTGFLLVTLTLWLQCGVIAGQVVKTCRERTGV
jgi:hypothetical protein